MPNRAGGRSGLFITVLVGLLAVLGVILWFMAEVTP